MERRVASLVALEPTVIVLSEDRATGRLNGVLEAGGFDVVFDGADPMGGFAGLLVGAAPGVAATLRAGLTFASQDDGHRFAVVDVGGWSIARTYIPGYERHSTRKAHFWQYLLREVEPALRDRPALLCGDLNTGLHYRDELGATFECAEQLAALYEQGWRDAWIERNPKSRPPASWWSPQAKSAYRLDHAILSPASPKAKDVAYRTALDDGTLLTGVGRCSDHAALVVDLRPA
jgi:exonuclease III